jgi:hypothetical protein
VDLFTESTKIAEVVEASTTEFVAQCYNLDGAPDFGSFVRVRDRALDIYAVVSEARTASLDPGRRPVVRGQDAADEDALYRDNPEIRELLRTEFTATVIGFTDGVGVNHYLPPRPPRIHGFVYPCAGKEVCAFTARLDFLQTLLASPNRVALDELIAATIRNACAARGGQREFLIMAGKQVALLLANDVNRLNGVLRRIGR